MNNFDLRKYLAEGKLRVNEGDMDHLMQDLERELKQHDWFYYMADDSRSYGKGELQQREIKRLLKMLNNSPEAVALYNKYAPVQGGIDLRIKEEKRPDYPDVDKDGDTEESMEKALKDRETNTAVKEEYNVGKGMEKDHDFDAMLAHALKLHAGTPIEDLKKVAHDFEDVNYHREVAYLADAIDMLEAGKHEEFEDSLKLFKDEVEKTIRSFNESIGEDYDPDQEQLDDEDEIFMPMDDEGRPLEEALNPEVTKAVNRFIKGLAKKYDYPERDAVFAIQAALKQRGFDTVNEATRQDLGMSSSVSKRRAKAELKNPGNDGSKVYGLDKDGKRVHLKSINDVDKFKKFELDADIYEVNEDLDIGHEDNEPGMIKADLYKIGKYAMDLYKMMDSFEGAGEVDFPHWWQSKISTAKSMIDGAKHYLEFELKEPAIDATINAADMEESIDREFHSTSKTSEHPNWEDLSAEEIQDYIDANPDTLWGRSLSIAKMVLAQKIDAMATEDNLEEVGMFNDPVGYEKSQPETPVFTKEYVGKDAYNILKNGKKLMTLFGSEGEANAYINKRNRELKEEETSFFTKDVKDAVVSKLMDQLKK